MTIHIISIYYYIQMTERERERGKYIQYNTQLTSASFSTVSDMSFSPPLVTKYG